MNVPTFFGVFIVPLFQIDLLEIICKKIACRKCSCQQAVGSESAITKWLLCIFKMDMSDLCLRLVRISMGLI